ncbi:MAG: zinc-finger domain-containing protein [Robiginitomaculum sp.]|nr:zinc-finger domain-containing protein [Robiginitomaculum sp.]
MRCSMPETNQPEIIPVQDHRVACDGGGGALGHPKVYMDMGQNHSVQCKYCDRKFVLKS